MREPLHLALAAFIATASMIGIILSALTLSAGLLIPVAGACAVTGAVGTYGFFSTLNKRSAKLLTEQPNITLYSTRFKEQVLGFENYH